MIALERLRWNDWTGTLASVTVMQLDFLKILDVHLVFWDKKKNIIVLNYISSTVKTLVLSSVKCGNAILIWYSLNDLCIF